jgi:hypothetical protein
MNLDVIGSRIKHRYSGLSLQMLLFSILYLRNGFKHLLELPNECEFGSTNFNIVSPNKCQSVLLSRLLKLITKERHHLKSFNQLMLSAVIIALIRILLTSLNAFAGSSKLFEFQHHLSPRLCIKVLSQQ